MTTGRISEQPWAGYAEVQVSCGDHLGTPTLTPGQPMGCVATTFMPRGACVVPWHAEGGHFVGWLGAVI